MTPDPASFDTKHSGPINDAQFDYYGKCLATASSDSLIRLWDVSGEYPRFLAELNEHKGPVWQVSWSHPKFGNLLASCSYDNRILVWKETQGSGLWQVVYRSEEHSSSVNCIAFGPWELGLHLAAGSSDGTVSILSYSPEMGLWSRKSFSAHPGGVLGISWASGCPQILPGNTRNEQGSRRLVTSGVDQQVRVWNYAEVTDEWTGGQRLAGNAHSAWVRDVAWRPQTGNSPHVASCSDDGTVIIWTEADNQTWSCKQVLQLGAPAWKISWSVTGTVLAASLSSHQTAIFKENAHGIFVQS